MTNEEIEELFESITADQKIYSVEALIEGLQILSKYWKDGLQEKHFCDGEHEKIYFSVDLEKLAPDSKDGKRLFALGFYPDTESETWKMFT